MSRGPGVRAMVGVCGSPGEQREGRGMGGDCAVGCAVSVYVSARSGALAWRKMSLLYALDILMMSCRFCS